MVTCRKCESTQTRIGWSAQEDDVVWLRVQCLECGFEWLTEDGEVDDAKRETHDFETEERL